jgi:ComF family protein
LSAQQFDVKMDRMLRLSTPLRLLADLLIPRECCACQRPLSQDEDRFCPPCTQEILKACGVDYCPRCGRTAEPYLVRSDGCPDCRERRLHFDGIARVGTYGSIVGGMIKRFKFTRTQRLDDTLGWLLSEAMRRQPWLDDVEALIPVPADWRAWLTYRFHPAGLIAERVGRRLSLPVRPMVRVRHKPHRQTGLPESQRLANIRGVFRLARRARPAGKVLCVIDDVSTSGATLREMARVLKQAGAARVYAAVVARTQLGQDDAAWSVTQRTST